MRTELQNIPGPQWFHHGEQVLSLLETHRPMECVELGSYVGGSAIAIARTIRPWCGQLTCVDAWGDGDTLLDECFKNLLNAGVDVRMKRGLTVDVAKTWTRQIDFLYVDADHSYEGCLADLETWWPHVKSGGLVCGDDYGRPEMGVTQAWDEFEGRHGQTFHRTETSGLHDTRLVWGLKC